MAGQTRTTRQKHRITEEINAIKGFFDAETLYERVRNAKISKATIYRYLNDAVEHHELYSYLCGNHRMYAKGKQSHCHYTCEKTGKIIHFDVDNIDFLKDKIPGTITSFQLEVKGICTHCHESAKTDR